MCAPEIARDPFRVLIGELRADNNSDQLLVAAEATGLVFNVDLNQREAESHRTRIRALAPRILRAYDALPDEQRLVAAQAAVAALRHHGFDMELLTERLNVAGWALRDTQFVVQSPETREVFFPKGSQWDAFVVLRDRLAQAHERILVVDPYCDATVFELLAPPLLERLRQIDVLCRPTARADLRAGARRLHEQYPNVTVRLRTTLDFHDRFLVLDGAICIHVGASLNHAGTRAFMVSDLEGQATRDALLAHIHASWNDATEAT